jgi:hypothetical protein
MGLLWPTPRRRATALDANLVRITDGDEAAAAARP